MGRCRPRECRRLVRRAGARRPCGRSSFVAGADCAHQHVGSLHAADAGLALHNARDVYTRRQEGVSIWVVHDGHHGVEPRPRKGRVLRSCASVMPAPTFYIPAEYGTRRKRSPPMLRRLATMH